MENFKDMFEAIAALYERKINAQIKTIITANMRVPDEYQSPKVDELIADLAVARAQMPRITFNSNNPFFKSQYTDLDGIVSRVTPALSEHGLILDHFTEITPEGKTILHTRLWHKSGQWIETRARIMPAKDDIQSYGSAMSYQKRFNVMNILGVTCGQDEHDDDGEIAMAAVRNMQTKGTALNRKYNPKETGTTITPEQLEELQYELQQYPDIAEQILSAFKIQDLADLPKSKYQLSIDRIREIKKVRDGD